MVLFERAHAEHYMENLPHVNGWELFHLLEYFKENNLIPDKAVLERLEKLITDAIKNNTNKLK